MGITVIVMAWVLDESKRIFSYSFTVLTHHSRERALRLSKQRVIIIRV
jgi:hypothetical protein